MHQTSRPKRVAAVLLRRVVPATLALLLLLDLVFRLLPAELFTYRAWEPLSIWRAPIGGFRANAHYDNPRSSGDLTNFSNRPGLRQFRREVFTTDEWGNRNPHPARVPFSGVLVLGDSFAVGSGVADEFTLGEQLAAQTGLPVYNGARANDLWQVIEALQMTEGLVIWEQSERDGPPAIGSATPHDETESARITSRLRLSVSHLSGALTYSPMRLLAGRVLKRLQNDRILPNPYRDLATLGTLRNGRQILFLPSEIDNAQRVSVPDVQFFDILQKNLRKRGLQLLVLLVPDKYVVYADLLQQPPARSASPPFMDVMEQRLIESGIPVVNLTTHFRSLAAKLLPDDEYIYWLDDTHWNAAGIRAATEDIFHSPIFARCRCG